MNNLNILSVQKELGRREISIFSSKDFVRIFRVSPNKAKAFLGYHQKDGIFQRAKRGMYILASNSPSKFEVANFLYKPSYISFESALSFYHIIPETVYSITSATTRLSKEFNVQNQVYEYRRIKRTLFFGYAPVKFRGRVVFMANREKALLDYLYSISLKKRMPGERIDLSKLDKKQLGVYVNYFTKLVRKKNTLINLIKKIH